MINVGDNKSDMILYLFSFLISSILFCSCLNASTINTDFQHDLIAEKIREAMDAYYRMDDQRAENIFNEAIGEWPEDPQPSHPQAL